MTDFVTVLRFFELKLADLLLGDKKTADLGDSEIDVWSAFYRYFCQWCHIFPDFDSTIAFSAPLLTQ